MGLEQVVLFVRLNDAVGGRLGRARQNPAIGLLPIIKKAAGRGIDRAGDDLAGTRRARAGPAGVWQVGKVVGVVELIDRVEQVHIGAGIVLKGRVAVWVFEEHGEGALISCWDGWCGSGRFGDHCGYD